MNQGRNLLRDCTAALMMAIASMSYAQSPASTAPAAQTTGLIDGEVRKIDKDAGKITLRHSEIKKLDMPAMTMVFRVKDAAMLDRVKTGDKVKFRAEGAAGAFTVTEIEAAK